MLPLGCKAGQGRGRRGSLAPRTTRSEFSAPGIDWRLPPSALKLTPIPPTTLQVRQLEKENSTLRAASPDRAPPRRSRQIPPPPTALELSALASKHASDDGARRGGRMPDPLAPPPPPPRPAGSAAGFAFAPPRTASGAEAMKTAVRHTLRPVVARRRGAWMRAIRYDRS